MKPDEQVERKAGRSAGWGRRSPAANQAGKPDGDEIGAENIGEGMKVVGHAGIYPTYPWKVFQKSALQTSGRKERDGLLPG
jgi:hypothetical protein